MKVAEREMGKMQRWEKRKIKEVDAKAYQAEFDRAGVDYKREARKMVNEEVILRVSIAYRTGYKDGVAAAAGVLQLEANMNLTKSIPEAVVRPKLVLPYTEEECMPLPPEEFPKSEEEIEDVSDNDAEGGSGAKSNAGNVEEDANLNAKTKNIEKV